MKYPAGCLYSIDAGRRFVLVIADTECAGPYLFHAGYRWCDLAFIGLGPERELSSKAEDDI